MNIFEYLRDDEAYLERRLKRLTAHFLEWSPARVFDESVKVFAAVTVYLDKRETVLTEHLDFLDQELLRTLKLSAEQRLEIEAQINSLTQMHIDEDEFRAGLESLLILMINHRKFCQDYLFPQIENRLSKSQRGAIDQDFEELVFS